MSRKSKLLIIGIVAVILLAICTILLVKWANSPSTKTITLESQVDTPSEPTEKTVSTALFMTSLPSDFEVQTKESPTDSAVIQLTAFKSKGADIQVGITTGTLTAEGIKGVADYLYRLKSKDTYEQITPIVFPVGTPTFHKIKEGTEITSFLIQNNRYASISITGGSGDDQSLRDVLTIVAKNWRWM
ncbi:MAG: hypothetical protein ABIQ04_04635 [Candidatus Saccharimonadales bacterium]